MLQENSFFSSPMTYYGAPHNLNAEIDDEEWNFIDPWQVSLDLTQSHPLTQKIGLFLHWCDPNE